MNKDSRSNIKEPFWKKQYELLSNWQIQEANRFWQRFQISLALNASLLTAYAAIIALNLPGSKYIHILGPLAISLVSLSLSIIWIKISDAGAVWQDYWVNMGSQIEEKFSKEIEFKIFSNIRNYEIKAPIRKYRRIIPQIFILTWLILVILSISIICS